jgi:transposase-like protein
MADLLEEVLALSTRLGSVSEACRQAGVSRATFYRWRKQGAAPTGIHPRITPLVEQREVMELSRAHPGWGCKRLSAEMVSHGLSLSPPTLQKILKRAGLGSGRERWLALENLVAQGASLSMEQSHFVERHNPCFRGHANPPAAPGRRLIYAIMPAGRGLKPHVSCLHLVIDFYSCFAFGRFSAERSDLDAVRLLEAELLPFYEKQGTPVESLWIDPTGTCLVRGHSAMRNFLEQKDIHLRRVHAPASEGIARLLMALRAEVLGPAKVDARTREGLAQHLQEWLFEWNWKRGMPGFPNYGATPAAAAGFVPIPGQAQGSGRTAPARLPSIASGKMQPSQAKE